MILNLLIVTFLNSNLYEKVSKYLVVWMDEWCQDKTSALPKYFYLFVHETVLPGKCMIFKCSEKCKGKNISLSTLFNFI